MKWAGTLGCWDPRSDFGHIPWDGLGSIWADLICVKSSAGWGAWVAQLAKCPNSAQVMILGFMGLSPASGSVLIAWSLEPTDRKSVV